MTKKNEKKNEIEITRLEAVEVIRATQGKFFGVEFVKRTTGEVRKMQARLNVKKYLKGGVLGYNPKEKNLIMCFDMNNGYRAIAVEGITEIQANGNTYKVSGE